MKTCIRCKLPKRLDEFVKDKRRKDGCGSWCLSCNRVYTNDLYQHSDQKLSKRKYYIANKAKLNNLSRIRWSEKRDQYRVASIKWNLEHREQVLLDYRQRGVCANCHRIRTQARKSVTTSSDPAGTLMLETHQ